MNFCYRQCLSFKHRRLAFAGTHLVEKKNPPNHGHWQLYIRELKNSLEVTPDAVSILFTTTAFNMKPAVRKSLHFILIHLCPINRGNVLYRELYKRSGEAFLHFGPISTCPMFLSCIFGKCNSHNNYKVVQADEPCAVWQLPRVPGGRHREGVCCFIQTEG